MFNMENAKKYSSFIKRLVTVSQLDIRKKILESSNLDIIKAICEIILNIYYKHIPLNAASLRALKKNKPILFQFISSKQNLAFKKDLLINHSDSIIDIKEIFDKRRRRMNNPYKRMFILSEEEYNRLKLFQQQYLG